jgi:hypothetical protein
MPRMTYGRKHPTSLPLCIKRAWIDQEEIDRILIKPSMQLRKKSGWKKRRKASESYYKPVSESGKPREAGKPRGISAGGWL